jgi:hypothetical protein
MRIGWSVLLLAAALPVNGQEITFPASFDKLAEKAVETVDVTLDSSLLQMAGKFLSKEKTDEAKAKQLISGLKGIYVRSFTFDKEGEYSREDVESILSQLKSPSWSRIVGVRSKVKGENADIFLKREGDAVMGLFLIAAEPKQLTVVSISGPIKPEQLSELGGQFGVPEVEVEGAAKKQEPK